MNKLVNATKARADDDGIVPFSLHHGSTLGAWCFRYVVWAVWYVVQLQRSTIYLCLPFKTAHRAHAMSGSVWNIEPGFAGVIVHPCRRLHYAQELGARRVSRCKADALKSVLSTFAPLIAEGTEAHLATVRSRVTWVYCTPEASHVFDSVLQLPTWA